MKSKIFLIALLASAIGVVWAVTGRQAIVFAQPPAIGEADRLVVTGTNRSDAERILVIRIDDRAYPAYADRVNLERVIPPGPYRVSVPLNGLRTPSGRLLRTGSLHQIICFTGKSADGLDIEVPRIETPPQLPGGSVGWDLGPAQSPVWPGFKPLDPTYTGIAGANLQAIDRDSRKQASEGLTSDGIRGIEQLVLPLAPGRWYVTLWLHDRGEWEYLPHPLERVVTADSRIVWSIRHTPETWIRDVYLARHSDDFTADADVWTLFGEQAHGRVSFAAEVGDDGLRLGFSGHMPEAGYLAAVLAEAHADYAVRDRVEQDRADWWRDNWRIDEQPPLARLEPGLRPLQGAVTAARNTSLALEFELFSGDAALAPSLSVSPPTHEGWELDTQLRWGQWELRRTTLSSTLLEPRDTRLRGDAAPPAAPIGRRRLLHLQVDVPRDIPAGLYEGQVEAAVGHAIFSAPLKVQVVDVELPPADRPVGVYLERPVQFGWFTETTELSAQAMACDLAYLRKIGLSGISPGLSTPTDAAQTEAFATEVQRAAAAGFTAPFLAYAPFKRLVGQVGVEAAALRVKDTEILLAERHLPAPAWSIADEPSNPGQPVSLAEISRYIRAYAPSAVLAGHLNDPADEIHLQHLDLALINVGFGADTADVERIADAGVTPWLYNMPEKRAAAGFYLWRVGARGYLQWHARMPTADPFDPTDGREDDVQFLYPTVQACPEVAEIDSALFDLVAGITDLRWLLWLERQADIDLRAATYLAWLRGQVPDNWDAMSKITSAQMDAWRAGITRLALPAAEDFGNGPYGAQKELHFGN